MMRIYTEYGPGFPKKRYFSYLRYTEMHFRTLYV